jgi:hypothetical protein
VYKCKYPSKHLWVAVREQAFNYLYATPIEFIASKWMDFGQVTSSEFGPDSKLYVGTVTGTIGKITMNADYTAVLSSVVATVHIE